MMRIAHHAAGLKQAMLDLLEESRTRDERERLGRLAQDAAPSQRERLLADAQPQRALAMAYYERVAFLDRLEELVDLGQAAPLSLAEWTGLRAVREARAEHSERHPPCPECGKGLEGPAALSCRCGWRKPAKGKAA